MNIDNILELLQNNIDAINKKEFISSILNLHNNLLCYDSLNRMLIQLQYPNAFDLKSIEEWDMCGRTVINGSESIWVVAPHYEYTYVYGDDETKEADIHDLSIVERNKAIELNIIKRKSSLKDIKTIPVYDIRQTKKVAGQKFKVGKPILNHTTILKIFKEITGCTAEECDEYFYSVSENALFIPTAKYKDFATMIASAFTKYFLEILDTSEYAEEKISIIKEYTEYSLTTLLRGNIKTNIRECTSIEELIQIVSIVESIVEKVTSKIEYSGQINTGSGAVQNIDIIRKAEVVLDIFTAVSANKKVYNM